MGNSLFDNMTCPCRSDEYLNTNTNYNKNIFKKNQVIKNDIVETLLIGKLKAQNIIFQYAYEFSKIYLIPSKNLKEFCNSRNLFKCTYTETEKQTLEDYYETIYLTNFLAKHGLCLVYLKKSYSIVTSSKQIILNKNLSAVSGIFKVEKMNYKKSDLDDMEQVIDKMTYLINIQVMRNYKFLNSISTEEQSFELVFQRNMRENFTKLDYKYELHLMAGFLEVGNIKSVLMETRYKKFLLKSVMIVKINKLNRSYILVFEENYNEAKEYEYLVLSIEKGKMPNDIFLKDFVNKINDFDKKYELSCIVSDENKLLIVLYSTVY